ncbi:amino acid ABC transporter permease [Methylobacterium planeticum]|uniref:ABC transporter permease subunit n=1 Tax=Methylobacterium planeticum TaxID=2615211 RepID=A0A6N6MKG6_9HYPH|nr:ABC transporter permease subunit [Methylobacterium planeticum]KAB1070484.1 ABC transporter permease subunit [Methylobacterium planeticum]
MRAGRGPARGGDRAGNRGGSWRGLALQALLLAGLAALAYGAWANAADKLARQGIVAGFGFLERAAGFDLSQSLIPYAAATASYGRACLAGLLNTLLVSGLGIVLASAIGFGLGIARFSPNLILRGIARAYVELFRNVPLLLQLLVWYVAVRVALPEPRDPAAWRDAVFLTQRGLFLPRPDFSDWNALVPGAFGLGLLATLGLARASRRRAARTGRGLPLLGPGLALCLGLPALAWIGLALAGRPVPVAVPLRGPFDIEGGLALQPEFTALLAGLSTYTAAFIAEIVRAGIASVPRGQVEAATALGLSRAKALRLVVLPQALRVILPPLTSQYLTLTKNSSLAVLIGYPDLVHVMMGTVLNQTNQAVEAVTITMAVYLAISLATAAAMNRYNARVVAVGRR